MSESQEEDHRAKGNKAFRDGDFKLAKSLYTQAIRAFETHGNAAKASEDVLVLYRNRAQCNLKLGEYTEAKADATFVLERKPDDLKALFRRAQAAQKLDDLQHAYDDALRAYRQAPQNTEIGTLMKTVYEQLMVRRVEPNASSGGKFQTTLERLQRFNEQKSARNLDSSEHYLDCANNYLVLCRDESDMSQLYSENALETVCTFTLTAWQLETEANRNSQAKRPKAIAQAGLQSLATLCKHDNATAMRICTQLRSAAFLLLDDEHVSSTASLLLNNALRRISGIDDYRAAREDYEVARRAVNYQGMRPYRDFEIPETQKQFVRDLLGTLTRAVNSGKIQHVARDAVIELLTYFVPSNDFRGLHYVKCFIGLPDPFWDDPAAPTSSEKTQSGLQRLLDATCSCAFAKRERDARLLDVSTETRSLLAVCLARIYDGLTSDAAREHFATECANYVTELLGENDNLLSKLEALTIITVLLEGPSEVGGRELGRGGLFDMVIAMLSVSEGAYRAVALDVLIAALRKPKSSAGLTDRLVPTLKTVYRDDPDEGMKVRALVGLCKLASVGGTDASVRPLADGSLSKLASSCKRFLKIPVTGSSDDVERVKHAIEGLAYLTLDAEVKEELVDDNEALRAIWSFAQSHPAACLFPCAAILVNVTNSYDSIDPEKCTPELIELAKFSKQHVPEQHTKDSSEFVEKRITRLVQSGVASAMRALTERAQGGGPRELLSRAYQAIVRFDYHRGVVVQQGGGKALLSLAQDGNEVGCIFAAQALAKLCITLNPQLALPGQRVFEVIRPLIKLLHVERTGLQNFEGLMALTNIASLSTKLRDKIVKEGAFPSIENYLFEEHAMIRRAAAECICNLIQHPDVIVMHEAENDRVKMLLVLCWTDEDDIPLVRAASGALARLTAESTIVSLKILQVSSWYDILRHILSHPAIDVQHRGVVIIQNMVTVIETEKTVSEPDLERTERERRVHITRTLVESTVFELILALTKFDEELFPIPLEHANGNKDANGQDNEKDASQSSEPVAKEQQISIAQKSAKEEEERKRIRKLIQTCANEILEVARGYGLVEKQ